MGWYVTCDICGKTGKYGYNCNCAYKRRSEDVKKLIGMMATEVYETNTDICYKYVRPGTEEVLYACISLCGGNEGVDMRFYLVSEEQFNSIREEARKIERTDKLREEAKRCIEDLSGNPEKREHAERMLEELDKNEDLKDDWSYQEMRKSCRLEGEDED